MAYMLGFFAMGVGGVFDGLAGRSHQPARAAADRRRVRSSAGGWLASSGGELALYAGYAIPLGFLGNSATFTPAMNNIQGWFDDAAAPAVSIISVGPGDLGLRLAADLSLAAARCRLAPDAGDLRRHRRHAAVPLRLLRAARRRIARSKARQAAEDMSALADVVALDHGAAVGRGLLLLCRRWPCPSCTWWPSAATSAFRRARGSGGDLADPADGRGRDLRHGPALRLYRADPGQPAVRSHPDRLAVGLRVRREPRRASTRSR